MNSPHASLPTDVDVEFVSAEALTTSLPPVGAQCPPLDGPAAGK